MAPLNNEYEAFLKAQTQLKKSTNVNWRSKIVLWPEPADLSADFFRERLKSIAPSSSKNEIWLAKSFFKWKMNAIKTKLRKTPKSTKLLKEKENIELRLEELSAIKVPRGKESVTIEDLYTHEELSKMLNATHHTRDRAMVEVLYESAFRASELLSMTFKGIVFQEDGTALVTTTGKTGTRQIPIFRSVPALKTWMNVHPTGEGKIWAGLRQPFKAIDYQGLYVAVRRILKRAKLGRKTKRVIHMFRHTRATELVRMGIRGQALNKFMGWTKKSNMEAVYVHLSTHDVTNEIRSKVFGIDPLKAEAEAEPLLKSRICFRCETHNEQGARFCVQCNMPLSKEALKDLVERQEKRQEKQASLAKQVVALQELVKNMWETTMAPSTGKVIEFKDGKVKFVPEDKDEDEGGGPVLPDEESHS